MGQAVTSLLGGALTGFATKKLSDMMKTPETPATTVTPIAKTDATTVDPQAVSNNNVNLGRAALISTSTQGVLGTEPVGRKRVLGN